MIIEMTESLGIDVGLTKGLHLVGLSSRNEVTYVSCFKPWDAEEFIKIVDSLKPKIICIDAPSGWAQNEQKSRLAERSLKREFQIQSFYTPCEEKAQSAFYDWVRRGQEVFTALEARYPLFLPKQEAPFSCEVFPNATSRLLAEKDCQISPKEKQLYRSTVLKKYVKNTEKLKGIDEFDAALAALTGIFILKGDYTALGDPAEGYLLIPSIPSR